MSFSKKGDYQYHIDLDSYKEENIPNLVQIAYNLGGQTGQQWDWRLDFYFERKDQFDQFNEIVEMMRSIERE